MAELYESEFSDQLWLNFILAKPNKNIFDPTPKQQKYIYIYIRTDATRINKVRNMKKFAYNSRKMK